MNNHYTYRVTEYTRNDGVTFMRRTNGNWVIRCIFGCAWFWHPTQQEWVPITKSGKLEDYEMSYDKGIRLFKKIGKKEAPSRVSN